MGSVCVFDFFFSQGVGGAVQYPKNYLKEAYKLVRERGGVCIADEVRISLCILMNHSGWIIVKQSFDTKLRGFTFSLFPSKYFTYPHEAMLY